MMTVVDDDDCQRSLIIVSICATGLSALIYSVAVATASVQCGRRNVHGSKTQQRILSDENESTRTMKLYMQETRQNGPKMNALYTTTTE